MAIGRPNAAWNIISSEPLPALESCVLDFAHVLNCDDTYSTKLFGGGGGEFESHIHIWCYFLSKYSIARFLFFLLIL